MTFNGFPPEKDSFPDEQRAWEPSNAGRFAELDPLNPVNTEWGREAKFSYNADIEFRAWRRLPAQLRGQAWREREITAFIQNESFQQRWSEVRGLEGFERIGIGRRPWEAVGLPGLRIAMVGSDELNRYRSAVCDGDYKRAQTIYAGLNEENRQLLRWDPLAIVLFFYPPIPASASLYERLKLAPLQSIRNALDIPLEEYGLHNVVPIIFEESRNYLPRGSSPGLTLQGGQKINGISLAGNEVHGTLTALVEYSYNGSSEIGLLGCRHVLGDKDGLVYQDQVHIGKVLCAVESADIALVEMSNVQQWHPEILSRNLYPANPIPPVSGMPGEYFGAVSQTTEESFVSLVYVHTPDFYKRGSAPKFEMWGKSKPGDSGALVLSGHDQQEVENPNLAEYKKSLTASQLAAILGMLVDGVDEKKDCVAPARILAVAAKDIEIALYDKGYSIRWLTRKP